MLIVRILGGLGNQMFQYAFYKYLKKKYTNVYADISDFSKYKLHNGYELNNVFGLEPDLIDEKFLFAVKDKAFVPKKFYFSKLKYKLTGKKKCTHIFEEEFGENLIGNNDLYLSGYWQNTEYFNLIKDELYKDFTFQNISDLRNLDMIDKIKNSNSVAIHVRRGDYLKHNNYDVCSKNYYYKAVETIEKEIISPKYYIFTDDIYWARKNFYNLNAYYVNHNKDRNSYLDMMLMKHCKHNIIANSTFSWWAAWLNNYQNKIIIAPKRWFSVTEKNEKINKQLLNNFIKL